MPYRVELNIVNVEDENYLIAEEFIVDTIEEVISNLEDKQIALEDMQYREAEEEE